MTAIKTPENQKMNSRTQRSVDGIIRSETEKPLEKSTARSAGLRPIEGASSPSRSRTHTPARHANHFRSERPQTLSRRYVHKPAHNHHKSQINAPAGRLPARRVAQLRAGREDFAVERWQKARSIEQSNQIQHFKQELSSFIKTLEPKEVAIAPVLQSEEGFISAPSPLDHALASLQSSSSKVSNANNQTKSKKTMSKLVVFIIAILVLLIIFGLLSHHTG